MLPPSSLLFLTVHHAQSLGIMSDRTSNGQIVPCMIKMSRGILGAIWPTNPPTRRPIIYRRQQLSRGVADGVDKIVCKRALVIISVRLRLYLGLAARYFNEGRCDENRSWCDYKQQTNPCPVD